MCIYLLATNADADVLPPLSTFATRRLNTMHLSVRQNELRMMAEGFDSLNVVTSFHPRFLRALRRLRKTTVMREMAISAGYSADFDLAALHNNNLHLQHTLYSLPSDPSYDSSDGAQELCRLSALCFCHILYIPNNSTIQSALFAVMAFQMSKGFTDSALLSLALLSPGLALWILLIGTHLTAHGPHTTLFSAALANGLQLSGILSLSPAESILARFFYLSRIFRPTLQIVLSG